jgi:hypothetical protein
LLEKTKSQEAFHSPFVGEEIKIKSLRGLSVEELRIDNTLGV